MLRRPFANKWLNLAITWELMLLCLIVYLPVLHEPFGTFALNVDDWIVVGLVALTVMPILELTKFLVRRRVFGLLD